MFFQKLDSWLVDRLEAVMWRVEYYTGLNNFFWARCALGIWVIVAAMSSWAPMFFFILLSIVGAVCFKHSLILEAVARPGSFNPERAEWKIRTLIVLLEVTLAVLASVSALDLVRSVSIVGFFHLIACSPMPPHWHKAKEERRLAREAKNLQAV